MSEKSQGNRTDTNFWNGDSSLHEFSKQFAANSVDIQQKFGENLVDFVATLYDSEQYSDIIIKISSAKIRGHRFVLSARKVHWSEAMDGDEYFIDLSHFNSDVAVTFIKWIYTGTIVEEDKLSCRFLLDLFKLSKEFHVYFLCDSLESFLIKFLDVKTFAIIYREAFYNKAKKLEIECLNFIKDSYNDFEASDFAELPPECLLPIVRKSTQFLFHEAARLNRSDLLEALLTNWNIISVKNVILCINESDEKDETPLNVALNLGNYEICSALILAGASVNTVFSSDGRTLLQRILLRPASLDGALYLLSKGCSVENSKRLDIDSPLQMVCKGLPWLNTEEQAGIIEMLLKKGANPEKLNYSGRSALHLAILHQNDGALEALLNFANTFDVDVTDTYGIQPLWYAFVSQFPSANVSPCPSCLKSMGFHDNICVKRSDANAAKRLLEAGADPNRRMMTVISPIPKTTTCSAPGHRLPWPSPHDTPLLAAARNGMSDACLFLLQYESKATFPPVDPNAESQVIEGETALHLAVENGLIEVACVLARLGANPNKLRTSGSLRESTQTGNATLRKGSPVCDDLASRTAAASLNPFDSESDTEEGLADADESFQRTSPLHLAVEKKLTSLLDVYIDESDKGFIPECVDYAALILATQPLNSPVACNLKEAGLALSTRFASLFSAKCSGLNGSGNVEQPDWFLVNSSGSTVFGLSLEKFQTGLCSRLLLAAISQLSNESPEADGLVSPKEVFSKMDHAMRLAKSRYYGILQRCIILENCEAVRFLLDHSVDVNISAQTNDKCNISHGFSGHIISEEEYVRQEIGFCPLWLSLSTKQWVLASLLVQHNADINTWISIHGLGLTLSLLQICILLRLDEAAVFLLQAGCDYVSPTRFSSEMACIVYDEMPFCVAKSSATPLHLAAALDLSGLVDLLLCASYPYIEVNACDIDGRSPLHLSIIGNCHKATCALLRDPRTDLRLKDAQGCSPFHLATRLHNIKAARLLQENDASLSLEYDVNGKNFLHTAVQSGDREAIFFLVQAGTDVNAHVLDIEQFTPLHLCVINGCPEDILRTLILAGASVSELTNLKQTCLHLAVIFNRPQLMRCLLENGASPNAQDVERMTPLHLAIQHSNLLCTKYLLSLNETDAAIGNFCGQQPLHILAKLTPFDEGLRDALFQHRPDINVNARDASDNTPLMLAFSAKNTDFCIYLAHSGATLGDVNADNWGIFSGGVNSPNFGRLKRILDSLIAEPAWNDSAFCADCMSKFGIKLRKHHCRHCGRILCSFCSNFDVPIVKFGLNKPVRVCHACFTYLNNPGLEF